MTITTCWRKFWTHNTIQYLDAFTNCIWATFHKAMIRSPATHRAQSCTVTIVHTFMLGMCRDDCPRRVPWRLAQACRVTISHSTWRYNFLKHKPWRLAMACFVMVIQKNAWRLSIACGFSAAKKMCRADRLNHMSQRFSNKCLGLFHTFRCFEMFPQLYVCLSSFWFHWMLFYNVSTVVELCTFFIISHCFLYWFKNVEQFVICRISGQVSQQWYDGRGERPKHVPLWPRNACVVASVQCTCRYDRPYVYRDECPKHVLWRSPNKTSFAFHKKIRFCETVPQIWKPYWFHLHHTSVKTQLTLVCVGLNVACPFCKKKKNILTIIVSNAPCVPATAV